MNFAEKLSDLRMKKGLSLEDASRGLDFSVAELETLEKGNAQPTIDELKSISAFYHISLNKLLDVKDKKLKKAQKIAYKIKKRQVIGFNRYGMKAGFSIIVVPIIAFISLCLMFTPGFSYKGQRVVSLMQIMFSNNLAYMIVGSFIFLVFGFVIIYWAVILALGNYYRAKLKVTNNILLAVFSGITLGLSLCAILLFKENVLAGGIVTYVAMLLTPLIQIVFLIVMNLEGGEGSQDQIYIYHECDYSGYETRHWFTLGLSTLSLATFVLFFVITAYQGRVNFFQEIKASFFDIFFKSTDLISIAIGVIAMICLVFNIVYWILICCLPHLARRKTNTANNVLLVIINIILCVDTVAMMSHFGYELFNVITIGGACIYTSLFITSIYGICLLPIINSNKKIYVRENGILKKVESVEGNKPGKIIAYKFSSIPQYVMLALIMVLGGISFISKSILFIIYFAVPAFVFEIIFLCFQRNGRYVNISIFIYGILLNTFIAIFCCFLLIYSLFNKLGSSAIIAVPIVSAGILVTYCAIIYFLKPIRANVNKT